MSDRRRSSISKELLEKEFVSVEEKSRALATGIFNVSKQKPFLGSVLQCLNIMYSHMIPTAGIMFNTDAKRWDMYINPKFFCKDLDSVKIPPNIQMTQQAAGDLARRAILLHEISHITNKHPFRVPFLKISSRKHQLMNIAADMAINQFIENVPDGCPQCPPPRTLRDMAKPATPCSNENCCTRGIFIRDFFDVDEATGKKIPWQENQTMEFYYQKLLQSLQDPEDEEDGEGDGSGQPGQGNNKKQGNAGGGASHGNLPQTIDEHMWDGAAEEKDMLEATEDLIKRAMIKQRLSYDELPGGIRELLQEIEVRKNELDYKKMILLAIKRSASGHERKHTWTRKSRRFGAKAPGTKVGDLPKLEMFLDTSGSISTEELNEFLEIVDNFLKAGSRKCRLNLFHTDNYYSEEYKLGTRLDKSMVQSGGTDLDASFKEIAKRRPDLAIFVTDGCYGNVEFEKMIPPSAKFPQTLFIISREGSKEHPIKRLGITIQIPNGEKGTRGKR